MSTTRTTSDRGGRTPYTVVGGGRRDRVRRYPYALTLLVLSRGDRLFRSDFLRDLEDRPGGGRLGEDREQVGGLRRRDASLALGTASAQRRADLGLHFSLYLAEGARSCAEKTPRTRGESS